MYENVAPVPLSCDRFWTTKDFATYVEVLHKAWPSPFPISLFEMFEKGNCCSFFCLSSLFLKWLQKGAEAELGLE